MFIIQYKGQMSKIFVMGEFTKFVSMRNFNKTPTIYVRFLNHIHIVNEIRYNRKKICY